MNFDIIPISHHPKGFYIAIAMMVLSPLLMLTWFRRKGLL